MQIEHSSMTGLYKLPPHLAKPLLYTIKRIFLQFHTPSGLPMHTCATDWQTDWCYILFSFKYKKCIYFLTVNMPKAMVMGTQVPAGNRDSDTRVQNLYPALAITRRFALKPFPPYHFPPNCFASTPTLVRFAHHDILVASPPVPFPPSHFHPTFFNFWTFIFL